MGLSCRHFIPDGDRGKYLRQTRRLKTTESEPPARHARLRLESGDALGGRRHDACFRHARSRLPAARLRLRVSWKIGIALLTGKETGKFLRFSRFLRKPVSKTLGIQLFTNEFPSKQNRELIRDNREINSPEQGTIRELRAKSDPLAATHPMASKCASLVEQKIINRLF